MDVIVEKLNGILWGPWFIYGILLIGLFFSIITRFLQVRHIKDMFVLMFKGRNRKGNIFIPSNVYRIIRTCRYR